MGAKESISATGAPRLLFWSFAGLTLLSFFAAVATNRYFLFGAPAALILAYLCIVDFKKIYYLLWAFIPMVANSSGDVAFMVLLAGVFLIFLIRNGRELDKRFFVHPVTLLLYLHLAWLTVTMITSSLPLVSVKFLLAKAWYVLTFYFLTGFLLKKEEDTKKWFWWVFIPLMATVAM